MSPFLSHIPVNPGCQNGYWAAPGLPQGFISVALQEVDIGVGIVSDSFPFDNKHLGILHQPLSKPFQALGINGKGRKMGLSQVSCPAFFCHLGYKFLLLVPQLSRNTQDDFLWVSVEMSVLLGGFCVKEKHFQREQHQ